MSRKTFVDIALKYVGVHEATGHNDGAQVEEFQRAVDGKAQGESWCFDNTVEILTNSGWKLFNTLTGVESVAQVDENQKISFVIPTKIIHKVYTGKGFHIKTRSMDFKVDEKHRFWGWFNNCGSIQFDTLDRATHSLRIPNVYGSGLGTGFDYDELSLLATYLSDGFMHKTRQDVPRIRVQVSKKREIKALETMDYVAKYEADKIYGSITKKPLTVYSFEVPVEFFDIFEDYLENIFFSNSTFIPKLSELP